MIAICIIGGAAQALMTWTDYGQSGPGSSGFGSSRLWPPHSSWDYWPWAFVDAVVLAFWLLQRYSTKLWARNWQWTTRGPDAAG
jgi:hypothetical protein